MSKVIVILVLTVVILKTILIISEWRFNSQLFLYFYPKLIRPKYEEYNFLDILLVIILYLILRIIYNNLITIRFVDLSDNNVSIKEHFIEFIPVDNSTGAHLMRAILSVLNKHRLELGNCRGQGYDNGTNMKGKNIESLILNTIF